MIARAGVAGHLPRRRGEEILAALGSPPRCRPNPDSDEGRPPTAGGRRRGELWARAGEGAAARRPFRRGGSMSARILGTLAAALALASCADTSGRPVARGGTEEPGPAAPA